MIAAAKARCLFEAFGAPSKLLSPFPTLVGLPIGSPISVESLGMMPTMGRQQMLFLPGMEIPTGDDFTRWTNLQFSVFIGILVVLPFNCWIVMRGKKMGMM